MRFLVIAHFANVVFRLKPEAVLRCMGRAAARWLPSALVSGREIRQSG